MPCALGTQLLFHKADVLTYLKSPVHPLSGPPSETYTFDIPENVMVDVRLIANWLSNHNSDAYMTSYARLRAGILVR